jgi:hypothetical protein
MPGRRKSMMNEYIYLYKDDGTSEKIKSKDYKSKPVANLFMWSNTAPEVNKNWKFIENSWRYIGPIETDEKWCSSCNSPLRNCIC